jgi:hypothetical protein
MRQNKIKIIYSITLNNKHSPTRIYILVTFIYNKYKNILHI